MKKIKKRDIYYYYKKGQIKDIKKLSDEELSELINKIKKIKEKEKENSSSNEKSNKRLSILLSVIITLVINGVAPEQVQKILTMLSPVEIAIISAGIYSILDNLPQEKSYYRKKSNELLLERKERLQIKEKQKQEIEQKEILEKWKKIFTENEYELTTMHQESYKRGAVESLIKNGANPDIVNLPSIQKIFDYEVTKPIGYALRNAFSYDNEKREIREDGTFDIVPCTKDYRSSFPIYYDYRKYSITYCEEKSDDNYLLITCPDGTKITLDKNGEVTKISNFGKTINLSSLSQTKKYHLQMA